MPVWIAVVRICECAVCVKQWGLPVGEEPPDRCMWCGSTDWEWGPESRDSRFIRQRISKLEKVLNPGVTSKKRQLWGKKQWRGFKPKPPEVQDASQEG